MEYFNVVKTIHSKIPFFFHVNNLPLNYNIASQLSYNIAYGKMGVCFMTTLTDPYISVNCKKNIDSFTIKFDKNDIISIINENYVKIFHKLQKREINIIDIYYLIKLLEATLKGITFYYSKMPEYKFDSYNIKYNGLKPIKVLLESRTIDSIIKELTIICKL